MEHFWVANPKQKSDQAPLAEHKSKPCQPLQPVVKVREERKIRVKRAMEQGKGCRTAWAQIFELRVPLNLFLAIVDHLLAQVISIVLQFGNREVAHFVVIVFNLLVVVFVKEDHNYGHYQAEEDERYDDSEDYGVGLILIDRVFVFFATDVIDHRVVVVEKLCAWAFNDRVLH